LNSLQRAVLWVAVGLGSLLALIVIFNLDEIDPNGAMNVLVGAIGGCIAAAVGFNRNRKDDE